MAVGFVVGTQAHSTASLLAAVSTYLLLSLGQRVYWNHVITRADRARYAFDGPTLRALTERLWAVAHPLTLAPRLRLHHALGWMMQEAWDQALAELSVDDGEALDEIDQAAWWGNRAFCRAQLGQLDEALTDARRALELAEASEEAKSIAAQKGIIGAVLMMRREPREALPYLQASLAQDAGPKGLFALRQFFLGEAQFALGDQPAAQGAWKAAVDGGAFGSFGARARERLRQTQRG